MTPSPSKPFPKPRPRPIARILDRLAFVCFQRPPLDYDALEAYLDRMAGQDNT